MDYIDQHRQRLVLSAFLTGGASGVLYPYYATPKVGTSPSSCIAQ